MGIKCRMVLEGFTTMRAYFVFCLDVFHLYVVVLKPLASKHHVAMIALQSLFCMKSLFMKPEAHDISE